MVTCNFVVYKPYYNSFAVEWSNAIKVYTSEWRDDCTNFIEYTIYDNQVKKTTIFCRAQTLFLKYISLKQPYMNAKF